MYSNLIEKPRAQSLPEKTMDYLKENNSDDQTELDDVLDQSYFSKAIYNESDDDEFTTMSEDYFRKISDL